MITSEIRVYEAHLAFTDAFKSLYTSLVQGISHAIFPCTEGTVNESFHFGGEGKNIVSFILQFFPRPYMILKCELEFNGIFLVLMFIQKSFNWPNSCIETNLT